MLAHLELAAAAGAELHSDEGVLDGDAGPSGVRVRTASGVERFTPDRHPVVICGDEPQQVYGFPANDGPAGGVKTSCSRAGQPTTPETIDRTVHPAEVAQLPARAVEVFPDLTGLPLDARTCMNTTTPDQHFVVAPHPGHSNVVVACGFSGHGFDPARLTTAARPAAALL